MLETLVILVLVAALIAYVYSCERQSLDSEDDTPGAYQANKGYPVVQYKKLPFARPSIPYTADPRVMNPAIAAAPVQFPEPEVFGSFGVTDSVAPVWDRAPIHADEPQYPPHKSVTTLPLRTTKPAGPVGVDFVQSSLGSLHGAPVDMIDANLTPPGMARPASEWAWINYGSK